MGMAEKKKQVKKIMTVRERSEQIPVEKRRIVHKTARKAATPFRFIGRLFAKVLRPLRFLLWPFKIRPARFIGRIIATVFFLRYFRNAWREVRQVTWPDRKETRQLTIAVFVFAFVFGALVTITDYGLDKLMRKVILK